jgi:nitrogen fixation protein NifQ
MTGYTDTIRRWAADDRRAGALPGADGTGEIGLGTGEAGKRLAVRFALRVRDNRVETVRYQVFGCGFTMAACAVAADLAEGQTLDDVAAIAPSRVDTALSGLPPERDYCASLAVDALQAAVRSVHAGSDTIQAGTSPGSSADHAARVTTSNLLYRQLIDSPAPPGIPPEDRHLFACLVAVATAEPCGPGTALGLSDEDLSELLRTYFPSASLTLRKPFSVSPAEYGLQSNPELLSLLLAHLPHDADGWNPAPSLWLAHILAARASQPGHLWVAMGLFARPELTAAIVRHLPTLAAANSKGMRWKRFLFRQLCEQSGGLMCKTPDCGVCSDYALCFGTD